MVCCLVRSRASGCMYRDSGLKGSVVAALGSRGFLWPWKPCYSKLSVGSRKTPKPLTKSKPPTPQTPDSKAQKLLAGDPGSWHSSGSHLAGGAYRLRHHASRLQEGRDSFSKFFTFGVEALDFWRLAMEQAVCRPTQFLHQNPNPCTKP